MVESITLPNSKRLVCMHVLILLSILVNLYELHPVCYPSVLKLVHSNREVTASLSACALLPSVCGAQRSHFFGGSEAPLYLTFLAMPAVGVAMPAVVRSMSYKKQILCKASKKRTETSK